MGSQACRLLRTYWRRLPIVAREGGYYGEVFKEAGGVTKGDPLSPTIFNVVVDELVCHWVTLVMAEAEKQGERGNKDRHQAALFYADDGMVASSDPRWLQWAFDTLVSLFERVGLQTNVGKIVSMVCRPYQAAGTQSEETYGRRMTGEGPAYQELQKGRVQCGDCGKEMASGSLVSHRVTQHGWVAEKRWSWEASATGGAPQTYRMALPTKGGPQSCPVEGCPCRAGTRTAMQMHFFNWHVRDIVIILEEGNLPHPRCPQCDMLVSWRELNGWHYATAQCAKGAEQKRRRMADAELMDSTERAFEAYGKPLETVSDFKYLGGVMKAGDNN